MSSRTEDCPFCQLEHKEKLFESEHAFAIRDRFPVSPGHTLIIPKRHFASYFEASESERFDLWVCAEKARELLLKEGATPDGFNIGINVGVAAGQTVMHVHLHVIPRFNGDMPDPRGGVRGVIPWKQKYFERDAVGAAADLSQLPGFVPGQEEHFAKTMLRGLELAESVDLLAAFVQPTGVRLLRESLEIAGKRKTRIRILTGDYLGVTSADALRALLQLTIDHPSIEAALYETGGNESFHPKSYVFRVGNRQTAYVGSSNLSRSALEAGVEWNLRLHCEQDPETISQISHRFELLWKSPKTKPLTPGIIDAYERRHPVPAKELPEPRAACPVPNDVQAEALFELSKTRREGHRRGLVILATGLGKTHLSAFDFLALGGRRALFIAHREEILDQAKAIWASVFPEKTIGTLGSGKFETDVDLLFASIQTLARERHLSKFKPEHFDYVVVDEFHHASARTYRAAISFFQPHFLLGLTATPDRLDGESLMDLCDDNLVFRQNLVQGISRKLLSPFRYFGVKDTIDFEPIPWRSGRFDESALENAVIASAREQQVLAEYLRHAPAHGRKAIAFCCTTRHANHMAQFFREKGIAAAAVHSGPNSASRSESLEQLKKGKLEILCAVDIFNEGLDVPDVNIVLMLRPTLSPVIFLQQLGRGLRKSLEKQFLTIVDFIGNHRSFLQRPQSLAYMTGENLAPYVALDRIRKQDLVLPEGCSIQIETDAIDMLSALSRLSKDDTLLHEYTTFRDAQGRRPMAGELFARSVSFDPVRKRFGDWFAFVEQQGDLDEAERRVWERHRSWFADVLTTSMSKAFKMLAVQALLEQNAFLGGMSVAENQRKSAEIAKRSTPLWKELLESPGRAPNSSSAERLWLEMPIKIWTKGTGDSQPWFALEEGKFRASFKVAEQDLETFQNLTEELVELRLKEHLNRLRFRAAIGPESLPIVLQVTLTDGKPTLRFDRKRRKEIPSGATPVVHNGKTFTLEFEESSCSVAREREAGPNILGQLARELLVGSDSFTGAAELLMIDGHWNICRSSSQQATHKLGLILYGKYDRDNIAEIFGSQNNPSWKVGHRDIDVAGAPQTILMVDLRKDSSTKAEHRYADVFLSRDEFQWESQRQTAPGDARGRRIVHHVQEGRLVHLFARYQKRGDDFVYCGTLTYLRHAGEKPIRVWWQLDNRLPEGLWKEWAF